MRTLDIALSAILVVAITVVVVLAVQMSGRPPRGEAFSELYILDATGKAGSYPDAAALNTPQTIIVGVGNHEGRRANYRLVLTVAGSVVRQWQSIPLDNGGKWEEQTTFTLTQPGQNQKVEFLLYLEGAATPLATAHLLVDAIVVPGAG